MGILKLGVQSLPAAETGLVRALVQLMAHGRSAAAQRWAFADQGPFDALVTDISTQAASLQAARAVLRLAQPGEAPADADVVPRPLRADTLERWLDRVAARIATDSPPAHARAAAAEPRWKLRRWPPSELLRADPQRVRLATMLSRRALGVDELATLANVAPEKCRVFVQLLQSFDLLGEEAPAPAATPAFAPVPPSGPASTPSASPAPARWRLVSSIRRKLGLGGLA